MYLIICVVGSIPVARKLYFSIESWSILVSPGQSWSVLVSPTGPESWGFLVLYQELSNNYQESCRNPPGICQELPAISSHLAEAQFLEDSWRIPGLPGRTTRIPPGIRGAV